MQVCVQKFGGSSLSTPEGRLAAVQHVERAMRSQQRVVVVVSAMGRRGDPYATDTLLELLPQPSEPTGDAETARERDLLLSCGELMSASVFTALLRQCGHPTRVFTGGQAGITTDGHFGDARIIKVDAHALQDSLSHGEIPVVAGFQGLSSEGEVTTLGRGGSDTTAVALGVALQAEMVDIFTDVPGVMTADPHLVPQAHCLSQISYTQCHALAQEGAKVLHPRAVELAMAHGLSVRVRSTLREDTGTLVTGSGTLESRTPIHPVFTGVTQRSPLVHVEFGSQQKSLSQVLFALAQEGMSLEGVTIHEQRVTFTVQQSDWSRARQVLHLQGCTVHREQPCARVTLVGEGIRHGSRVQAGLLSILGEAHVPVLQLGDTREGVWCLVEERHLQVALGVVHETFLVHSEGNLKPSAGRSQRGLLPHSLASVPAAR